MTGINKCKFPGLHLKPVVHTHSGGHKPDPDEQGRNNAGPQTVTARVINHAVQNIGHDQMADCSNNISGRIAAFIQFGALLIRETIGSQIGRASCRERV